MDLSRFLHHFSSIAAQRGWHLNQRGERTWGRTGLDIILPAQDQQEIDRLSQDPIDWTLRNLERSGSTPRPGSAGTVRVRMTIETHKTPEHLPTITGAAAWGLAIGIAAAVMLWRRKNRQPANRA